MRLAVVEGRLWRAPAALLRRRSRSAPYRSFSQASSFRTIAALSQFRTRAHRASASHSSIAGYSDDPQGLQVGDVIELDRADSTVLAAFAPHAFYANGILNLPIRRGVERFVAHFRIHADVVPNFGSIAFVALGDLWMLAFAFAIGVRGAKEPHARILCLVLLAFALPNSIFNASSPWLWYEVLGFIVGPPGMAISALLLHVVCDARNSRHDHTAHLPDAWSACGGYGCYSVRNRGGRQASLAETIRCMHSLQQPLLSIFVFAGRFSPSRLSRAYVRDHRHCVIERRRARPPRLSDGGNRALVRRKIRSGSRLRCSALRCCSIKNVYNVNNFFVFLVPRLGLTYAAR